MKKSILFLIPTLGGGGAERVLTNLTNNLDSSKYDITVQTIFKGGVNAKYLAEHIKYIEGSVKEFHGNTYLQKLFTPRQLYRHIIGRRYDIVVSYLEGTPARILSGCPFPDTKLVSWVHIIQQSLKTATYCYRSVGEARNCLSRFNTIVCVAETIKSDYISIFPELQNVRVLYNTNDDVLVKTMSKEPVTDLQFSKELNVISAGKLTNAKGYDRLINVHKRLIDEGIKHHVYILGNGANYEALQEQINNLGVQDTFHLLGFKDNPYKYISKADAFCCPSRLEGYSTSVSESMILGIPVVTTDCSGAYEQCGHNNEYGIVVPSSEDGIYEGLKRILTDKELILQYKAKAIERGKMFSKTETIKAVEQMLEDLF